MLIGLKAKAHSKGDGEHMKMWNAVENGITDFNDLLIRLLLEGCLVIDADDDANGWKTIKRALMMAKSVNAIRHYHVTHLHKNDILGVI